LDRVLENFPYYIGVVDFHFVDKLPYARPYKAQLGVDSLVGDSQPILVFACKMRRRGGIF